MSKVIQEKPVAEQMGGGGGGGGGDGGGNRGAHIYLAPGGNTPVPSLRNIYK